ncbi:hypothetical protein JCM3774_001332 [Rhodotorula dairenensis]
MAPPLDYLRDDLDQLLSEYLDAIDHYQLARARLADHLKSGYFDLARSKLALGPGRVGPARYNLSEQASHKIVQITPTETDDAQVDAARSWSFTLTDRPVPISSQEGPSAPVPGGQATTLRRRRATQATTTTSSINQTEEEEEGLTPAAQTGPSRPSASSSPLAQFSALPPPALRASAASFTSAAGTAVAVVDAEARVRDCARRVKRCRKRLDRSEEAAADEAARAAAAI